MNTFRSVAIAVLSVLAHISLRAENAPDAHADAALGIGFLWTRQSRAVVARLDAPTDFVDVILGRGKLAIFEEVKPPVRVACIARSLEDRTERPFPTVRDTIATLRAAGIAPERVIIAYNPERQPGTPSTDMDNLVASVRRAKEMAESYGAPLLVGPGLREMERREELYPELARWCDIWLIQSQRLQLDLGTRRPVSVDQYRTGVKRIADLLRQGNPDIRVCVQLVATAERGKNALTAQKIAAYATGVEDIVDAVRIYGAGTEVLARFIDILREE